MADELRKMVTDAVDANWSMARDAVKNTVSIGIAHAEAALTPAVEPIMEQAQAGLATAGAYYKTYREIADVKFGEAKVFAEEWPNTSAVLGAGAVVMAIPGTRRILYNQTILRLMSKQGRINHVEKRASWLKEGLDTQTQEYQKLQERIALAEDEYLRGRAKLLAAGSQLRQLSAQAKRYQGQALELAAELRVLPADVSGGGSAGGSAGAAGGSAGGRGFAPRLRAEVDGAVAVARRQKGAMEGQLRRIVSNGVAV